MAFDITKHVWSEEGIYVDASEDSVCIDGYIDKSDVIALARHFGLIKCNHEFPRQGLQECIECGEPILGGRLFNDNGLSPLTHKQAQRLHNKNMSAMVESAAISGKPKFTNNDIEDSK